MLIFKAQSGGYFLKIHFCFYAIEFLQNMNMYEDVMLQKTKFAKTFGKGIQTRSFNRGSTIRCLRVHFSRLYGTSHRDFLKNSKSGRLIEQYA
jgi:hypothetical protein